MQPGRAVLGPTRSASPAASSVSLGMSSSRYFSDELPQLKTMMRMAASHAIGNPAENRNSHQTVRYCSGAVAAGDELGNGYRFALAMGLLLVAGAVANGCNAVLVHQQTAGGAHSQASQLPAAGANFALGGRQRLPGAREQRAERIRGPRMGDALGLHHEPVRHDLVALAHADLDVDFAGSTSGTHGFAAQA